MFALSVNVVHTTIDLQSSKWKNSQLKLSSDCPNMIFQLKSQTQTLLPSLSLQWNNPVPPFDRLMFCLDLQSCQRLQPDQTSEKPHPGRLIHSGKETQTAGADAESSQEAHVSESVSFVFSMQRFKSFLAKLVVIRVRDLCSWVHQKRSPGEVCPHSGPKFWDVFKQNGKRPIPHWMGSRNAGKWNLSWEHITLHASNIKGFLGKFACSHPAWIGPHPPKSKCLKRKAEQSYIPPSEFSSGASNKNVIS